MSIKKNKSNFKLIKKKTVHSSLRVFFFNIYNKRWSRDGCISMPINVLHQIFAENSLSVHAFGTYFSPEVFPGAEDRAVNKSKILVFMFVGKWGGVQGNNK